MRAGVTLFPFLALCAGLTPKRRFLLIRQAFKCHLAVLALWPLRAGGSSLALRPPLTGVAFFAPRPLRASVAFFAFRALRADKFPVVELLLHVVCRIVRPFGGRIRVLRCRICFQYRFFRLI